MTEEKLKTLQAEELEARIEAAQASETSSRLNDELMSREIESSIKCREKDLATREKLLTGQIVRDTAYSEYLKTIVALSKANVTAQFFIALALGILVASL